ncbi:MAG TPA: hypothetical protein VHE61_00455 [Opitutaceae bacterium]|nr:hypothetical protein [Opitutaceae bacterium]
MPQSPFLHVEFSESSPEFSRFAVDSLGRGETSENVVLIEKIRSSTSALRLEANGDAQARYVSRLTGGIEVTSWHMHVEDRRIVLRSRHVAGFAAEPFRLLIDQKKNHATLLGLPVSADDGQRVALPAVLHLPDRGTLRISATLREAALYYEARRRQPEFFVEIGFPPATASQPEIEYTLESTLIHPALPGLENRPLYDGYRRSFLNLLQFHPRLRTLANNSSSDVCGFCFWMYAELAAKVPPLAPGFHALDLVRLSLDRVLDGGLTYGQAGYRRTPQYPDAAAWSPPFDSLDLLPSLTIAGAIYLRGTQDRAWAKSRFDRLVQLVRRMLAQDRNGNGLIEYPLSGNADSWTGDVTTRPANWWDTIGFGHEDAYANALAFRACRLLAAAAQELGRTAEAEECRAAAERIRAAYCRTFLNPATGILAGWKSADGALHDYWFVFVNGMAIAFGLVEEPLANAIMDRILGKMREVGFDRFDLGLPGNLVPVCRADYTDRRRRYGGPELADGSDAFQTYENGAATHCHTYWTIKALYQLGRVADARRIFHPMLRSFAAGNFQGFGANGMSKDWRDWQGNCNGYEGYLCDGFLALLAVEDDLRADDDSSVYLRGKELA